MHTSLLNISVMLLRGIGWITLNPGEMKTVEQPPGPDELSFGARGMRRVVEPGTFAIMVGENSEELLGRSYP
jgi:beta-glucosidase